MHAVTSGSLFHRPLGEVSSAVKHAKSNWRWEWKGHWRRGGRTLQVFVIKSSRIQKVSRFVTPRKESYHLVMASIDGRGKGIIRNGDFDSYTAVYPDTFCISP